MKYQESQDPYHIFTAWLQEHITTTTSKHPFACAFSTIGLDGFPNTRYVALKELQQHHFIVTGPLHSRKGREIKENPKVALTFWWEESLRQIRIQGEAQQIDIETADFYFSNRNKEAQTVSLISKQGVTLDNYNDFFNRFRESVKSTTPIKRPENWGGWKILPTRIEFLEFKTSRLHKRTLYTRDENQWDVVQLQP